MTKFLLSHEAALELQQAPHPAIEAAVGPKEDRLASLRGGILSIQDSVGVIDVYGALVYDSSYLSRLIGAIFGQTLFSDLQTSLHAAAEDSKIRGVLLKFNTPGGSVFGTEATAALIRSISARKPVIAQVESQAASAGYWLAAAATRIHAAVRTAHVGSVGVVATIVDNRAADAAQGRRYVEIVSTQSPRKRPDHATEEGRAQLQAYVDGIAEEFLAAVARYRGVSAEKVATEFGMGDMLRADQAIAVGMIDGFATESQNLELIHSLSVGARQAATTTAKGGLMSQLSEPAPAVTPAATDAAVREADRTRIAAILNHPEASGRESLARHLALETDMSAEAAGNLLTKAPRAEVKPGMTAFERAMAATPNPKVGSGAAAATDDEATLIASMLQYGNGISKELN